MENQTYKIHVCKDANGKYINLEMPGQNNMSELQTIIETETASTQSDALKRLTELQTKYGL